MGLGDILRKHYVPKRSLGGPERVALLADLQAFRRRQTFVAIFLFACVFVLFVVGLWGGIVHLRDPSKLGLLTGGLGITAAGAVALMAKTMRDWGRTDLTLMLIMHSDEERGAELLKELRASFK